MNTIPFIDGFFLGLSLILAVGAQNSFVIRQGLAKNYVIITVAFCAIADILLIITGISGIGLIAKKIFHTYREWIFILAALWIAYYGFSHIKNVFKSFNTDIQEFTPEKLEIQQTLIKLFVFTFINPHVYLDTLVLIGIVSLQYNGTDVWSFGFGASLASVIFFCTLGFGASAMSSFFRSKIAWRVLDCIIASIMIFISLKLIYNSGII